MRMLAGRTKEFQVASGVIELAEMGVAALLGMHMRRTVSDKIPVNRSCW